MIVRSNSSRSQRTLRNRLTLTLDGDPAPLADRQPAGFETDTVDVAFAVSKSETYDSGRVLHEQAERRSLSASTLDRLNNPPVFEVSNPTVSPDEIEAGARTDATVRFEVHNTGDGSGTFGASVSGNLVSGSATMTATLDSGTHREVSTSTPITGDGDAATVQLDWGTEEWSTDIPVVGTLTSAESPTGTPYPQ